MHRRPLTMTLLVSLSTCTPTRTVADVDAIVRMEIVDAYHLKPSHFGYDVVVELRNPSPEPRWLIWPLRVPEIDADRPGVRPVRMLELQVSTDEIWLAVADETNMRAVRLPGRGTLTKKGRMTFDREPESISFTATFASAVLVDGRPLESYFHELLFNESGRTLNIGNLRVSRAWNAPVDSVPVELTIESQDVRELPAPPLIPP